ncbi:AAA family ATPase [Phenylobacterium sp.]|uniref:AAA family ATPase n=1 Tax=Phenylobacterium sp. TaxID=1871053 RepID=UPI00286ABDDA|nr:AAA family ATPase [Phenylobacterium sp.]
MGLRNYLIEGVSGTGKTTVADELQRRGHHVIHADRELAYLGDPETGEALERPDAQSVTDMARWRHERWIWDVNKVKSVIADQSNAKSFFCGGSRNHHHFVHLFDQVFVLDIDVETLNQRLAGRPKNEFGGAPKERQLIARLHATREDIPKNAVNIDATAPVIRVVDDILSKCGEAERGAG